IMHKLGVGGVLGDFFGFDRGIDAHAAAGKRHHRELMFLQQVLELAGAAEVLDHVRPQLNPAEAKRRDVLDRLAIISAPGDRGISEPDIRRGRSDWCIEIRKVYGRVKWRIKKRPARYWRSRARRRGRAQTCQEIATCDLEWHTGCPPGVRSLVT